MTGHEKLACALAALEEWVTTDTQAPRLALADMLEEAGRQEAARLLRGESLRLWVVNDDSDGIADRWRAGEAMDAEDELEELSFCTKGELEAAFGAYSTATEHGWLGCAWESKEDALEWVEEMISLAEEEAP